MVMQIKIKKLDGGVENFECEATDTVEQVKQTLAERAGFSKEQVRLIYKGTPMPDKETLAERKVQPGDVVHMILQMRG